MALIRTLKLAALIALAASSAYAQSAPTQIAIPDQSSAIVLHAAPRGAPPEQWTQNANGLRSVRNVVTAAIEPVLPDPANATGVGVIVAPGGGFMTLEIDNEGYRVARWLADHGIAAFVLRYRLNETPRDPQAFATYVRDFFTRAYAADAPPRPDMGTPAPALEDAQAAVRYLRAHAGEYGIDPGKIGFVGFSAGAMTTLSVALADDRAARPDFIAPIYGPMGERDVPNDAPAMFVAVALDDPLMTRGGVSGLSESWRAAGRPVEAHLYERGGHGFGMTGRRPASALWIDEFYAWMQDRGIIAPRAP